MMSKADLPIYCAGCGKLYLAKDAKDHMDCKWKAAHSNPMTTTAKPVLATKPRPLATKPDVLATSHHGRYADPEKRKAYMRELMKRRRATA